MSEKYYYKTEVIATKTNLFDYCKLNNLVNSDESARENIGYSVKFPGFHATHFYPEEQFHNLFKKEA